MRAFRPLLIGLAVLSLSLGTGVAAAAAQAGCSSGDAETRVFPSVLIFPRPEAQHFLAGQITLSVPVSVTVDAPLWQVARWNVCVRTPVGSLGNGKAIGDLQFYNEHAGRWEPLRNEFSVVATGSSVLQRVFFIQVRVLLDWRKDVPGIYGPTPLIFQVGR